MNEAQFSSQSDDEVDSEVEVNSTDESSNDDDDDDDDDSDDNNSLYNNDDDDDDSNNSGGGSSSSADENQMSGIGQDMQNLLTAYDTAEDKTEKRETKRVRID